MATMVKCSQEDSSWAWELGRPLSSHLRTSAEQLHTPSETDEKSYLAEAAPRSIRGLCICIFSGSVYLGIMLGYFANYGTSLHVSKSTADQWV